MGNNRNETELKIFMENIVCLRKRYGLSKKKMAKILGIGMASLNKIERGEMPKQLGVRILYQIEAYFKITPSNQFKNFRD